MGNRHPVQLTLPKLNFRFPNDPAHSPPETTHTKLIINAKEQTFLSYYYSSTTSLIECITPYIQLCNLVFQEGVLKGQLVTKDQYEMPLKELHLSGILKLKAAEKRLILDKEEGKSRYLRESVVERDAGLVFQERYCVENEGGVEERNLQDDTSMLRKNLLLLVEGYQPQEIRRAIHQSYKREKAKETLNPEEQDKPSIFTSKEGTKKFNPSQILSQFYQKRGYSCTSTCESTPLSVLSMLKVFGALGEDYSEGEFEISKWEVKLEELRTNEFKRLSFIYSMKEILSESLKVPEDKIYISEIKQDKILISYPSSCSSATITGQKRIFDHFEFSDEDFDTQGDRDYLEHPSNITSRGGYPYYQPAGWRRYGINVDSYSQKDGSDHWITRNSINEWAVMYHGVKNPTVKTSLGISTATAIAKYGLKVGTTHVHEKVPPFLNKSLLTILKNKGMSLDEYLSEQIYSVTDIQDISYEAKSYDNQLGEGVYGSPLLQQICVQQSYAGEFQVDGVDYLLAFQCRVKPQSIYISSQEKRHWLVRKPSDVRPYGILITQKQHLERDGVKVSNLEFKSAYNQFCREEAYV